MRGIGVGLKTMRRRRRTQLTLRGGAVSALLGIFVACGQADAVASEARADALRLQLSDQIGPVDTRVEGTPVEVRPRRKASSGPTLEFNLDLEYRHNNNIFVTQDDQRSDFIRSAAPSVSWTTPVGKHRLELNYDGDWSNHAQFHSEDKSAHELGANLELDLHRIFKVDVDAGLEVNDDSRKSLTSRDAVTGSPDRWRNHRLGASLRLGRRIAVAQLQLDLNHTGTRYLNNGQEDRDIDVQRYRLEGSWNLRPRLSLLTAASVRFNDYQDPTVPLDSREYEVLIGASWEATAKTSGRVLLGHLWKDFDDPSQPGFSGRSWHGELIWSPRSFSRVTAYTSRDAAESAFDGLGSSIVDTFGLRWRHGLTRRFIINTGLVFSTSDLGSGEKEKQLSAEIGFDYALTRRLDLSVGYGGLRRVARSIDTDFGTQELYIRLSGNWDGPTRSLDW